jgi:pentatricopeptide repeat protein
MSELGVSPNQITFNCMIDACAKTGAMSQCQMWLEAMIKGGFHPDQRTCSTMSNAGTVSTERERSWAFESIILAYAKEGQVERAQHWLFEMVSDGLTPSDAVQNRLLHLCSIKDGSAAQEIKRKIQTIRRGTVTEDVGAVIDRYGLDQDSFQSRNQNQDNLQSSSLQSRSKGRRNNGKGKRNGTNGANTLNLPTDSQQNQKSKADRQVSNQQRSLDMLAGVGTDPRLLSKLDTQALTAFLASNPQLVQLLSQLGQVVGQSSVDKFPSQSAMSSETTFQDIKCAQGKGVRPPTGYPSQKGMHSAPPMDTFNSIPNPPMAGPQSAVDLDSAILMALQDLLKRSVETSYATGC